MRKKIQFETPKTDDTYFSNNFKILEAEYECISLGI